MTSTVTVPREPARSRTREDAPNAACPSCGSARFTTRLSDGHVLAACAVCDATYASVLELVTHRSKRPWKARAAWALAALTACAAVAGVLAFT